MIRFLPGLLIASVLALFQAVGSRFSISSLDANLFTIPLLGAGVALLLVSFQYLNGVMGKQHQLVPLFGPVYEAYRKAVSRKYFTTAQLNLLIRRSRISVMQKMLQMLRLISPVFHLPFILLS